MAPVAWLPKCAPQLRGKYRGDLREMLALESSDPLVGKSFGLVRHKAAVALETLGDFVLHTTFRQQQD
jgi:hypothetical protein